MSANLKQPAPMPGPYRVEIERCKTTGRQLTIVTAGTYQMFSVDTPERSQELPTATLLAAAPEIADALGNVLQLLIALGLANAPTAPQMLAEYPQVIAARAALVKAGL